jgi:SAM-dependent methyltransferase
VLSEAIARQYEDVAAVYDALMAIVPHASWLSRIEKAARQRGKSPHSALDIACGTGIATELLYGRGYRPVFGFDIAPAMVTVARTKATAHHAKIEFAIHDAAAFDLGGRTFDLAVCLFDSLNYITDPAALRRAFHAIYRHVAPGGIFAFDLNTLYALSHDLFSQQSDWGPLRHKWQAEWERETRLCRVDMQFWVDDAETGETRHFRESHLQRAYAVTEIRQWLTDAGFVKIEVFGNYGERPPVPKSDRILFVAEREDA